MGLAKSKKYEYLKARNRFFTGLLGYGMVCIHVKAPAFRPLAGEAYVQQHIQQFVQPLVD